MTLLTKRRFIAYGCILAFVLWVVAAMKHPILFPISGAILVFGAVVLIIESAIRTDHNYRGW